MRSPAGTETAGELTRIRPASWLQRLVEMAEHLDWDEPEVPLLGLQNLFEDWRMKRCGTITLLLLSLSAHSYARTAHHAPHSSFDPTYGSALAAANRFLHAWQNQDHETGIVMLADSARQHLSPELLQSYFSPGPDAAYEIAHGRRLKTGEYAFPLVLFGSSAGARPRYCKLVLVRGGRKDDWAVEKLP